MILDDVQYHAAEDAYYPYDPGCGDHYQCRKSGDKAGVDVFKYDRDEKQQSDKDGKHSQPSEKPHWSRIPKQGKDRLYHFQPIGKGIQL